MIDSITFKRAIAIAILGIETAFAAGNFNVRDHGAIGDGKVLETAAIQKAVDAAAAAKGGTVFFPPGRYLSGTIRLKSHVKLHLEKGATLLGSTELAHYQRLNFLALIMGNNLDEVAISGEGVIDGQGKTIADSVIGPVKPGKYPDAGEAKRPVIINFRNCRGVTVRDVTLRESACWVQLYRDCDRVTIENITVRTLAAITNDGLDIDGCSNVVIRGCDIDSEDDGICLKSSRRECSDVLIENCRVRSSCNALKFGTASFKGFRNITVRDLEIHDTYLSAIALECVDGGVMENVNISRVKIRTTNNALFIRLGHRNASAPPGIVRNITISDVIAEIPNRRREEMNKFPPYWRHACTTLITASITGLPGHPVRGVTLRNINILYGGIGEKPKPGHHRIGALEEVPECADAYPESKMFGTLPAWGIYCRHAEDLTLENVTLSVSGSDYRPALVCDDIRNISLDRLRVKSAGSEPVIVLKDVTGARVRDCTAPANSTQFLKTIGRTTGIERR
jgi:hypothetical protein